jgi:hypothetical protein
MKRNAALLALLIPFTLFVPIFLQAQETEQTNLEVLARDCVKSILDKAGNPTSITFSMENRSSLSAADTTLYRKAIEKQFRISKTILVKPERAQAEVKLTLSENKNSLLWIAEIKLGSETIVVMQEVHRPVQRIEPARTKIELEDEILHLSSNRILDFAEYDANSIIKLFDESLLWDRGALGEWAFIAHEHTLPRDARGRLILKGSEIEIHQPGLVCTGSYTTVQGPKLDCHISEDPWPITISGTPIMSAFFSPTRNFFTGAVVLADVATEQNIPPFFSAARVGEGANALWLFAGTNGKTHLYSKLNQPLKTFTGWGSSLATMPSECGGGWLVLVTRPGDELQNDQLTAMQIVNRDAVPASTSLDMNGSVEAMWTSADNKSVHVVIHNRATGMYEAHRITTTCKR